MPSSSTVSELTMQPTTEHKEVCFWRRFFFFGELQYREAKDGDTNPILALKQSY